MGTTPAHLNPLQKIEHVAVLIEQDVVKGVEKVITVGSDVYRVLTSVNQLAPGFKAELCTLIADAQPIATALAPVIASEGTNIAIDLAAVAPVLADIKRLVADFVAFLPTLKQAVADLESDFK